MRCRGAGRWRLVEYVCRPLWHRSAAAELPHFNVSDDARGRRATAGVLGATALVGESALMVVNNMTSDARVDVVPNSFKYFRQFQRAAKTQSINLRFGREFFHALARPKTWRMDEASPFEYERVLDPKPVGNDAAVLAHTAEKFPAFKTAKVAQSWGGYIDVTPDAVPVISAVDQIAGFFIATGMSGHGFGLRSWRRPADGGPCQRPQAVCGSNALPVLPFFRWLPHHPP